MTGVVAAIVVSLVLFAFSAIFAASAFGIAAGTDRLPLFFRGNAPPRRDLLGASGIAISVILALLPQLAILAVGLARPVAFGSDGSMVLLAEPIFAILFAWYLARRYRRSQ